MTRYVAIRGWQNESDESWQERPSCTVFERDEGPIPTGLLDAAGTPLYRVDDRAPMGFDLSARKRRISVRADTR